MSRLEEAMTPAVVDSDVELLRFCTAGSVDDGKSTLIGRLLVECQSVCEDQLAAVADASRRLSRGEPDLALLMDGLKDEREQGITIDVAYRYLRTPRRRFIIADTPGHEQYTRNMVTGASGSDAAVILLDAAKGMTIQSRRHTFIASLMGIPHVLIAVNKMDLVGYREDVFVRICREFGDFAAKLPLGELAFIPVSALHGENLVRPSEKMPWYDGGSLLGRLERLPITGDRNLIDFRMPIQGVCRPGADFRGFMGSVASGVVRRGDDVVVLPGGHRSRVTRIVTYDGERDYAFPPQAVTVCLADELDIGRGAVLAHPRNVPRSADRLDAMLVWMDEDAFAPGTMFIVKHAAHRVRGTIGRVEFKVSPADLHRREGGPLRLNEIARVRIDLTEPVVFDTYERNRTMGGFILIHPHTHRTSACGMIIDRSVSCVSVNASGLAAPVSRNISVQAGRVSARDRHRFHRQSPATVWLTGLSGSGKSTIAYALEQRLMSEGHACFVLDGDNVRHGLNRDLGFAAEERRENIRRVAEVAALMNQAGLIVIAAFISPYRADRRMARDIVGAERFVETHLDCALSVCESRDPKGLYRKARAGELAQFTGIDAPYEAPDAPELVIASGRVDVAAAVELIVARLDDGGFLTAK